MSEETIHEASELISEDTRNMHRALVSLKEELDAVDWYAQRAEACTDDALRDVLVHNQNEEIEHAMMLLAWIRRHSPVFDANIGIYVLAAGPARALDEGAAPALGGARSSSAGSLGIGSMKGMR